VTPAIHDGTIYTIGRRDGADTLAALAVADGSIRWTRSLAEPVVSADPVVTDHGVLVVDAGSLAVHDAESGDRRREIPLGEIDSTATVTVAADGGTAFVATREGLLAVDIDAETTRQLHDGTVYSDGISVGAETVVAMVEGSESAAEGSVTVTAFNRTTGDARWNCVTEGFHALTIPPILVDGAVFFATSRLNGLAALGDVSQST
jgi:outer membrane protein assembly factor BamB